MKTIATFLLSTLCFIALTAQTKQPLFIQNDLDSYVEEAIRKWQIPGASVCIVKDGKVIVSKGYGVLEMGSKKAVNENTIFMIGSNTKAFTGAALAMLENEKLCSLDDKIIDWLPSFTMKDLWVKNNATLTDIVTHRLGMETFQGDFMWWGSNMTEDMMIEKFGMQTPTYDFRTKWGYCNMGYVIAGACIEKISGKPWNTYLNNYFFTPLEMNRTYSYVSELENVNNVAQPHTIANDKLIKIPYGKLDILGPAASIQSSASDMGKWAMMLLNNGTYNGKEIIPQSALVRMIKPESIQGRGRHPFNKSHYSLYGLGWALEDYEGTEIISHTGGVDGYVTSVTLLPEHKLGIIVLTNTDQNYFYEALKQEIIDAYLSLEFRDYSNKYFNFFSKMKEQDNAALLSKRDTVKSKPDMILSLEEFEGTYEHTIYGKVQVKKKGKTLLLSFQHHPDLTATLEGLGGSRFLCTYSNSLYGIRVFPFVINEGQVKSFTLSVDDFLEFTTYQFVKID